MKHICLDSHPEAVRQFVLTLPVPPDGAVLELGGHPVAWVIPPSKPTHGTPPEPGDWTEAKNARLCDLIARKYAGTLTPQEAIELSGLQEEMLRYRQRVAPLPLEDARRLHQQLLAKAREQSPPGRILLRQQRFTQACSASAGRSFAGASDLCESLLPE